jgi:hypothetical protein
MGREKVTWLAKHRGSTRSKKTRPAAKSKKSYAKPSRRRSESSAKRVRTGSKSNESDAPLNDDSSSRRQGLKRHFFVSTARVAVLTECEQYPSMLYC